MTRAPVARSCETAVVTSGKIEGTLRLPGRLDVEQTVRIGSDRPGLVVAVAATVGARVEKGQVLARLDDAEERAAVVESDAKLSSAELLGLRAERHLFDEIEQQRRDGVLPEPPPSGELLEGKAGEAQIQYLYDAAQISKQEATVRLARQRLARRVVRAPMAGVVLARNFEPGESIPASPPGLPLFVLGSDPGQLRLSVEIDESYLKAVAPGPASFVVPAGGPRVFVGTVRQVVALPDALRSPAPYLVVLDVPNPDGALQPGMSAVVDLPMTTGRGTLSVPTNALLSQAEGATLWLADHAGRPVPTLVRIGVTNVDLTEVRGSDIEAGRVVISDASPSSCLVAPPVSPFSARAP